MTNVTRNVTVYTHRFGKYNPATEKVEDVRTFETTEKLSARRIAALSSANGTHLGVIEDEEKLSVPLDLFLAISRAYANDEEGELLRNPDGSYYFSAFAEEDEETE